MFHEDGGGGGCEYGDGSHAGPCLPPKFHEDGGIDDADGGCGGGGLE